jgi:primosomal protein N' (replication factor Y)
MSSRDQAALLKGAQSFADALTLHSSTDPALKGVQILGPSEAPIAKLRNAFRRHILIKAPESEQLSSLLDSPVADMLQQMRGVDGVIDVDAVSML